MFFEAVMDGRDHWTSVYRRFARSVYRTEAPIFDNSELTRQELELVEKAARELGATVASPILDVACGPGRHCRLLAERGHAVVGFDHSEGLLAIGAAAASAGGRRPAFVCADVHHPPFAERSFRTALLLGKSFGYFSDRENRKILRQTCAQLRPGGYFALELPDRDRYLASMRPVEREERVQGNGHKLVSEFRCRWDPASLRLTVRESHLFTSSEESSWEAVWDVRLYDAKEIELLLREAGFRRAEARPVSLVEAQGAKGSVLLVGAVK